MLQKQKTGRVKLRSGEEKGETDNTMHSESFFFFFALTELKASKVPHIYVLQFTTAQIKIYITNIKQGFCKLTVKYTL